jgi:hypothetical protein
LFIVDKEQSGEEKRVPTEHVARSISNKSLEYAIEHDIGVPNVRNDIKVLSCKLIGPSAYLSTQVYPL